MAQLTIHPPLGGLELGAGVRIFFGKGDPNLSSTDSTSGDLASASVGSVFHCVDGSANSSFYVKEAQPAAGTTGTGTWTPK